MTDNRFKDFPVDARFPSLGRDVRFEDFPTDKRFTGGLDTRFQGPAYGGGGEIPVITGVPTISGTATVGSVLTASPAPVTGDPTPTRTWQWYRGGVAIGGATSITYTLVLADSGATITVEQIETNTEGFDTAVSAGVAVAFTPASIFTGTDTGFWSSPITPSRLWQDVARTNPVTAPGQVAFAWELNTRTGVAYTLVPGGSSGFIYQVDANGRGYLECDGTNRSMTLLSVTGGPNFQAFAAVRPTSTAATGHLIDSDYGGGRRWAQFLRIESGGIVSGIPFSGTTPIYDAGPSVTAATNNVVACIARSGIDVDTRTNGVSNGVTTSSLTFNTTTDNISLGSNPAPNFFFNGRIYGLILRFGPNLTSTQITDTEAWLANLMVP